MVSKHMKSCPHHMSLRYYYTLIGKAKMQITNNTTWWKGSEQKELSLVMERQNDTASLEDNLVFPHETKRNFIIIWHSNHIPRYLPNFENLGPHQSLHVYVYCRFIHNPPKLNKLWYVHTTEYSSVTNDVKLQVREINGLIWDACC